MSVLSTTTKAKIGLKTARGATRRPALVRGGTKMALASGRLGLRASRPLLMRRARRRVEQLDRAGRKLGEVLAVYGPRAAYELGLAEPPKPKRTAPRVAAGVVLGAGAAYLLNR